MDTDYEEPETFELDLSDANATLTPPATEDVPIHQVIQPKEDKVPGIVAVRKQKLIEARI